MKTPLRMTGLIVAVVSLSSTALSEMSQDQGYGKSDIDRFCDTAVSETEQGVQFNGKKADETVLEMTSGRYSYPGGGALLLFGNDRYLIKLPNGYNGIYGTDGDDLLAAGGIVGGCSKEQLSEAVQNNDLEPDEFDLVERY